MNWILNYSVGAVSENPLGIQFRLLQFIPMRVSRTVSVPVKIIRKRIISKKKMGSHLIQKSSKSPIKRTKGGEKAE